MVFLKILIDYRITTSFITFYFYTSTYLSALVEHLQIQLGLEKLFSIFHIVPICCCCYFILLIFISIPFERQKPACTNYANVHTERKPPNVSVFKVVHIKNKQILLKFLFSSSSDLIRLKMNYIQAANILYYVLKGCLICKIPIFLELVKFYGMK